MKNTVDSLEEYELSGQWIPGRMVGNSTRMIDLIIQLLFDGKKVQVKDHYDRGSSMKANAILFDRVLRRLFREHPGQMKDHVKYDKEKLTIEFI